MLDSLICCLLLLDLEVIYDSYLYHLTEAQFFFYIKLCFYSNNHPSFTDVSNDNIFLLDTFFNGYLSSLSRFECVYLNLDALIQAISFFYSINKCFNDVMIFVWCPNFVLVYFKFSIFAVSSFINRFLCKMCF